MPNLMKSGRIVLTATLAASTMLGSLPIAYAAGDGAFRVAQADPGEPPLPGKKRPPAEDQPGEPGQGRGRPQTAEPEGASRGEKPRPRAAEPEGEPVAEQPRPPKREAAPEPAAREPQQETPPARQATPEAEPAPQPRARPQPAEGAERPAEKAPARAAPAPVPAEPAAEAPPAPRKERQKPAEARSEPSPAPAEGEPNGNRRQRQGGEPAPAAGAPANDAEAPARPRPPAATGLNAEPPAPEGARRPAGKAAPTAEQPVGESRPAPSEAPASRTPPAEAPATPAPGAPREAPAAGGETPVQRSRPAPGTAEPGAATPPAAAEPNRNAAPAPLTPTAPAPAPATGGAAAPPAPAGAAPGPGNAPAPAPAAGNLQPPPPQDLRPQPVPTDIQTAPVEPGRINQSDARVQTLQQPIEVRPITQETGERLREEPRYVLPPDAKVVKRDGDRQILSLGAAAIAGAVAGAAAGYFIKSNDDDRIAVDARDSYVEELPGGRTRETVVRPNGVQVVTVTNRYGDVIRRSRIMPDGREVVLFYDPYGADAQRPDYYDDPGRDLPPIRIEIPEDRYIVDVDRPDERLYYDTLVAPPVETVERIYSVDEVRRSERIRDKVRRIDLATINFDFASAAISQDQAAKLQDLAEAIKRIIQTDPGETFLIEGHTDAVGAPEANLILSDKRAEAVASALTEYFEVPAENLVTQGYGEQELKVNTQAENRENRRVTVRRITALVKPVATSSR